MILTSKFGMAAAALAFAAFATVTAPAQTTAAREITMTAKKYEFDPSVIKVKQGDRVRLIITATDRDHGFKLAAFNINQVLKTGEPATVEFTAGKTGTFPFECSKYCGRGHKRMKGQLIVE